MRQRLADVPHRQRLTGGGFDQSRDQSIVDDPALLFDADLGDDRSGLSGEDRGDVQEAQCKRHTQLRERSVVCRVHAEC